MMRTRLLTSITVAIFVVLALGCSDKKARVAAIDTETLMRLSEEYPANSSEGRLIAEELSRRTKTPTPTIAKTPQPVHAPPSPVALPTCEIVDEDKYDAPVKTQIKIQGIVSGTVTEPGLNTLLHNLYIKANETRGFKHHGGKPTHVFIYLYSSREHLASGMGQWIAMLEKVGESTSPRISVNTIQLDATIQAPTKEHGLSEADRRRLYKEYVRAEDRAVATASGNREQEKALSSFCCGKWVSADLRPVLPSMNGRTL